MSDQQQDALPAEAPYRALCLCLTCRDRNVLYCRIDLRVSRMVDAGILQEASGSGATGIPSAPPLRPSAAKEYFRTSRAPKPRPSVPKKLKQATRNYAKRQLTWFRNQNDAVWLYVDEDDVLAKATALVRDFLGK